MGFHVFPEACSDLQFLKDADFSRDSIRELKRNTICCFDLETIIGSDGPGEIISIGWALLDIASNWVYCSSQILVKPTQFVTPETTALTGLSWNELRRDGIPLRDACKRIKKIGLGQYVSAAFGRDDEYLRWSLVGKFGLCGNHYPFGTNFINAGSLLRTYFGDKKNVGLAEYMTRFGIPWTGEAHRADNDAAAVASCLGRILGGQR